MNEKPKSGDTFLVRKLFRFIPEYTKPIRTIIELEIYQFNICVVSFFEHNKGNEKSKYKVRSNIGPGHTLSIFKACLEAFYSLNEDYALVFSAANDVNKIEDDNSRYSAYRLFLNRYFENYPEYIQQGSIRLNTLILYHQSYQYKDEANEFYERFEKKVEANLEDTTNDNKI